MEDKEKERGEERKVSINYWQENFAIAQLKKIYNIIAILLPSQVMVNLPTLTDAVTVEVSLKYCCGPLAVPHQEPPVKGRPNSLNCEKSV